MDVRLCFRKDLCEYNDRICVIVVDINDIFIGFIVDNVVEVFIILDEDIVDLLKMNNGINNKYIKNIGKVGESVKLLFDCEKFLFEDEFEDLSGVM